MSQNKETHYEILKIHPEATMPEIQAAYQSAKAAYSRDSVATYTLFSPAEVEEALREIEAAYATLASWDKRRDYDKRLSSGATAPVTTASPPAVTAAPTGATPAPLAEKNGIPVPFTGQALKGVRERQNLTLEDVARITKIPLKAIRAIEEGDPKHTPARVYLQGFVKNLAHVYKLPPQQAAALFLEALGTPTV